MKFFAVLALSNIASAMFTCYKCESQDQHSNCAKGKDMETQSGKFLNWYELPNSRFDDLVSLNNKLFFNKIAEWTIQEVARRVFIGKDIWMVLKDTISNAAVEWPSLEIQVSFYKSFYKMFSTRFNIIFSILFQA